LPAFRPPPPPPPPPRPRTPDLPVTFRLALVTGPALDSTTCRLIMSRFRYRPALDPDGRPVAETIRGEHEWVLEPEPPPVDVEPDVPD